MHKYKYNFTKAGAAAHFITVIIVVMLICAMNTTNLKISIIAGGCLVLFYAVLFLLFAVTSFCTLNNDGISFFMAGFEYGKVKFSDIKEVNILPAQSWKYNFGSKDIVPKTDKKEIRIGVTQYDDLYREICNALK
ncbi:MAG: hypothetical protein K2N72_03485 [Oscillospiraceae bacterium]|nr:hypothetical protein [Oscillospiraceae bacterium]